MRIVYHGGKCCGVKTLFNLGYHDPYKDLSTLPAEEEKHCNLSDGIGTPSSDSFFVKTSFPRQTYSKRLKALLREHDDIRENGIIEAITTTYSNQTGLWKKCLEENGFEAVRECHNSNSGHRITFWLRCTDKAPAKKQKSLTDTIAEPATSAR